MYEYHRASLSHCHTYNCTCVCICVIASGNCVIRLVGKLVKWHSHDQTISPACHQQLYGPQHNDNYGVITCVVVVIRVVVIVVVMFCIYINPAFAAGSCTDNANFPSDAVDQLGCCLRVILFCLLLSLATNRRCLFLLLSNGWHLSLMSCNFALKKVQNNCRFL